MVNLKPPMFIGNQRELDNLSLINDREVCIFQPSLRLKKCLEISDSGRLKISSDVHTSEDFYFKVGKTTYHPCLTVSGKTSPHVVVCGLGVIDIFDNARPYIKVFDNSIVKINVYNDAKLIALLYDNSKVIISLNDECQADITAWHKSKPRIELYKKAYASIVGFDKSVIDIVAKDKSIADIRGYKNAQVSCETWGRAVVRLNEGIEASISWKANGYSQVI